MSTFLKGPIDKNLRKWLVSTLEDVFESYRYFRIVGIEPEPLDKDVHSELETTNELPFAPIQTAHYSDEDIEQRKLFVSRIELAVSRLPQIEKDIIQRRYMQVEGVPDFTVYHEELGVSEKYCKKHQLRGLHRLATMFGLNADLCGTTMYANTKFRRSILDGRGAIMTK